MGWLPDSVQWYEALWIAFMALGGLANGYVLYQSVADRAAYRRTADAHRWRDHPLRIVANQQIRGALLSLLVQVGGSAVGVVAATQPAPTGTGNPTRTGTTITLFLLFLALVLAAKPWLSLLDNRTLYGKRGDAMPVATSAAADRRRQTVESIVGMAALLFVACTLAYAFALWRDLLLNAELNNGVEFSYGRLAGQFSRSLLVSMMTGTFGALVMGAIIGGFYHVRGDLVVEERRREDRRATEREGVRQDWRDEQQRHHETFRAGEGRHAETMEELTHNTEITTEARDGAVEAFRAANEVNLKIAETNRVAGESAEAATESTERLRELVERLERERQGRDEGGGPPGGGS